VAEAPRVFISYSHDSLEHAERVLALSERLRAEGVDAEIDQYEEAPAEGWPRWMQNQIEHADLVLVVCTAIYAQRFLGRSPSGSGLGARWEGAIITQELYEAEARNSKFVPVLFGSADVAHVPGPLRQTTRYDVSIDESYEKLYRRLTSQPRIARTAVGRLRPMPPREKHGARFESSGTEPASARLASSPSSAGSLELDREALPSLLEAADLLSRPNSLERVLDQILALAGPLLRAEAGSVILFDSERKDLYFAAASGPKRDEVMALRLPPGAGKAGAVFQSGEPLLENVVTGHYAAVDRKTRFSTRSMLCVPLEIGSERFGVMQMLNKSAGGEPFGMADLALLARFASHAAVAIQRARMFEQLVGSAGLYALPEARRDLVEALARPEPIALRERMSVLSADMRGFTRLSHQLGRPEKVQAMLGDYVAVLAAEVLPRHGIVNKIVGDSVLAIFRGKGSGARAVDAALAMCGAFDALVSKWRDGSSASLAFVDLGIGVSTDEDTILGTIGNPGFRDFSLIGPAVLVASALGKVGSGVSRLRVDRATWSEVRETPELRIEGPDAFQLKDEPSSPTYEVFRVARGP
jgi:class 3 adenylate cyclase